MLELIHLNVHYGAGQTRVFLLGGFRRGGGTRRYEDEHKLHRKLHLRDLRGIYFPELIINHFSARLFAFSDHSD